MWLTNEQLSEFFNNRNYDVRISHDARWIDQKCTPDVLTIIADCIIAFATEKGKDVVFTSMDIWHSKYSEENVLNIFKKPNPNAKVARNEYDKFFQQPMKLLAYSGVIKEMKNGNRNFYSISNFEVLEYISIREKNSLNFLCIYIEKVLRDSGIYYLFDDFFSLQNKDSYRHLKDGFTLFTKNNTAINNDLECWRIFIKILNPLAYRNNCQGTERGNLSKNVITYDMLMYNRDNFRDTYKDKPKGMTRKEYDALHKKTKENKAYFAYLSVKAKKAVKEYNATYNNFNPEVVDANNQFEMATHMHHIFPEAEYPTISYFYENIIALHPTQHLNYAHPKGNTQVIDKAFQHLCLLAKSGTIKKDYDMKLDFYDFNKFMIVLSTGLNDETYFDIPFLNFDQVIKQINLSFQNL